MNKNCDKDFGSSKKHQKSEEWQVKYVYTWCIETNAFLLGIDSTLSTKVKYTYIWEPVRTLN